MQKWGYEMNAIQLARTSAQVAAIASNPAEHLTFEADLGVFIKQERKPRFIRPIPFAWLHKCNRLGGKTTQVALALWFLAGVKQSMYFKLTQEAVDLAGCSRSALDHGLVELEKAGLIETERRRGARPQIRIIEIH